MAAAPWPRYASTTAGIRRHLGRAAFANDATFGKHEDVLGKAHHRLHHVLDHHDGDAAGAQRADDRHHVVDFGGIETGQHFVEQEQLRPGGERTRKLEALSAGDRQRIGGPIEHIAEADFLCHAFGNCDRGDPRAMP